ncbi:MAG TPA: hypothetical protein V6C99_06310 [Oculatellaceae cyanobacterium]|jgi:hypothetical protein
MKLSFKDVLAVALALVAMTGLFVMWNAEISVVPGDTFNYQHYLKNVLPGLKQYATAFGAMLLAVSIAYILLGHDNDIETHIDEK